jgi:hypothetical protein
MRVFIAICADAERQNGGLYEKTSEIFAEQIEKTVCPLEHCVAGGVHLHPLRLSD